MASIKTDPPNALAITVTFDSSINYAFQQNAIPVVKDLQFQNDSVARKDLTIRVSTEPAFATPTEIRVQSVLSLIHI